MIIYFAGFNNYDDLEELMVKMISNRMFSYHYIVLKTNDYNAWKVWQKAIDEEKITTIKKEKGNG